LFQIVTFEPETLESQSRSQKNADSCLVSNANLNKILMPSGWAQVRYQQPKIAKNLLMTSVTKKQNPKSKFFFHGRLKDLASLLRFWTAP